MDDPKAVPARIPVSTYRLQFNSRFTFEQAREAVAYLDELGVGCCYSSPVLKARPGSLHGYDVVDHSRLNPEVGTEEQFEEFAAELRRRGMGLLMDAVPNHMCIASPENRWWMDLLEDGPGSPFARFFDVDWNPPNPSLKNKVLLPILGDQFGRVLENQEIKITRRGGAFFANYYDNTLPVAPRTTTHILEAALRALAARLTEAHSDVLELESVITALGHLPAPTETDPARVRERRREREVIRRRLSNLLREGGEAGRAVGDALEEINGVRGRPETFDRLERLLSEQSYRLSYWRVAADEINYRRFFDVNELAAVRVEERPVFTAVHERLLRLLGRGLVTGLRIDHVDGLFNPEKYLQDLRRECSAAAATRDEMTATARAESSGESDGARAESADEGDGARGEGRGVEQGEGVRGGPPCFVVVEKILGHDELLRREWPVHGTTGYDFLNLLGGLFVDQRGAQAFRELYAEFTLTRTNFADLLYECKKLILRVAMSSELHVLARRLARISERLRSSRDFTFKSLHDALGEVVACFPVYRTYIRRRQDLASADDRLHINSAVAAARRRNPSISVSIFDFIASILLLEDPKGTTPAQRAERRDFVMRFQQLTSPVMAKGLEDTAFYRHYPLTSLCEVGGEPAIFGTPVERFHRRNLYRQEQWPHALSATATHDTKRGEDVRARLHALSEMPEEWNRAVHRWRELNRARKTQLDDAAAPDANEEYLLYQTLVGAWPFAPMNAEEHAAFTERITEYMRKALREAKLHTSWINQNEEYERAVDEFVRAALDPEGGGFLSDFVEFQRETARAGVYNSLSQTLLKIASPGVPDFYQGTELWQLDLVDPDNRRPVDYEHCRALLASLADGEAADGDRAAFAERLLGEPEDGRVKLYVTSRALRFRRTHSDLFARGEYLPLTTSGESAENVVAFARRLGRREVLAVAGRFFTRLTRGQPTRLPLGVEVWGDTSLALGERLTPGRFRDVFTGLEVEASGGQGAASLSLPTIFCRLPVALLERV